jgi:excisionase family DNA binding protein
MNDPLYTLKEVKAMLKVSQATVYRMIYDGRLPHIKVGRLVRVPASAVRNLLEHGVESSSMAKQDTKE